MCMPIHFSSVWLVDTLCTIASKAPLSLGFSRQEYWSRLPCPSASLFLIKAQTFLSLGHWVLLLSCLLSLYMYIHTHLHIYMYVYVCIYLLINTFLSPYLTLAVFDNFIVWYMKMFSANRIHLLFLTWN